MRGYLDPRFCCAAPTSLCAAPTMLVRGCEDSPYAAISTHDSGAQLPRPGTRLWRSWCAALIVPRGSWVAPLCWLKPRSAPDWWTCIASSMHRPLGSAQLSSAGRSSAQLSSAQLSSAQPSSAQLSSARLGSAQLSSAGLSPAQLSSAQLSRAQLHPAQPVDMHRPVDACGHASFRRCLST